MTVLGFGGMIGFCIASYQSRLEQKEAERVMHEVTKYGIVEPPSQLQPPEVNQNQQPGQESPKIIDSVQPKTETQAENLVIPNSNDQPKQDSEIQLPENPLAPKKYGVLSPSDKPNMQNPAEIKRSLIELNEIIRSTCHPEPGTLIVRFVINTSGDVMNIVSVAGSTLKGSKSEECILDQISKYRFKNFEGSDIPVTYPLKFE
jgi:hypothetical protein